MKTILALFIATILTTACSHSPKVAGAPLYRNTASDVSVDLNVEEVAMVKLYERVLQSDLSIDISKCENTGAFRSLGRGRVCELRFRNLHLKQELYLGESEAPGATPILFVDRDLVAIYLPEHTSLTEGVNQIQRLFDQKKVHVRRGAYSSENLLLEWGYPVMTLRNVKYAKTPIEVLRAQ